MARGSEKTKARKSKREEGHGQGKLDISSFVGTKKISFEIVGNPVAKGRPRFSRQGFAYTPAATRQAEHDFKLQAMQYRPRELITGLISIGVIVYRPIPKSFSRRKGEQALAGEIRPITRPDCDNYLKLILDSMNGIFFRDDSQVVDVLVSKYFSDRPRIAVSLEF